MGTVSDILAFKQRKAPLQSVSPELSGEAQCMECGHKWTTVAEEGAFYLECPACGLYKGVFVGGCLPPEGGAMWRCTCGNHALYATPNGVYCCRCGKRQQPFS